MPRTVPDTRDHERGVFDPDHHLWRNGRLFWIAFTVHLPGWRKERVRLSLGTADPTEARRRRDEVLRGYPEQRGCALSLRIAGRPVRTWTERANAAGRDAAATDTHMSGHEGCAA